MAILDHVRWAEWDRKGRLVAAKQGRIVAADCEEIGLTPKDDSNVNWSVLADLRRERPPDKGEL